jgi:Mn2+/Fe2+ NRAMP family transporter
MLIAANRRGIVGAYRHPRWLTAAGIVVTATMAAAGAWVLWRDLPGMLR